jgi:hypothetical protein
MVDKILWKHANPPKRRWYDETKILLHSDENGLLLENEEEICGRTHPTDLLQVLAIMYKRFTEKPPLLEEDRDKEREAIRRAILQTSEEFRNLSSQFSSACPQSYYYVPFDSILECFGEL